MTKIKILQHPNELHSVSPLKVSHLLWGTKSIPSTYIYLGYVLNDGFYLRMVCEEANPLRIYTKPNAPVYQDSAMEAFFGFHPKGGASPVYLNFEMNANGVLLAGYGPSRTYRSYFTPEEHTAFNCSAELTDDAWNINLRIPLSILEHIYGNLSLEAGSSFTCNFYKISETAAIEHYASYSPITISTPSFHLPEYFETAILE